MSAEEPLGVTEKDGEPDEATACQVKFAGLTSALGFLTSTETERLGVSVLLMVKMLEEVVRKLSS